MLGSCRTMGMTIIERILAADNSSAKSQQLDLCDAWTGAPCTKPRTAFASPATLRVLELGRLVPERSVIMGTSCCVEKRFTLVSTGSEHRAFHQ